MVVDPEDGSYYVSNINGNLNAKDGNGFISKIDGAGTLVIQKFIGGKEDQPLLDAPKGLAIVGKIIYVADIDSVKGFDKETAKLIVTMDLSDRGAKFLNDIAADDQGDLFVSDTQTNRIFRIGAGADRPVSVFKKGKQLGGPNGVFVNPKTKNLMVVSFGSGQVLEIDRAGVVHVLKKGLTALDGIDADNDGNVYVSSFEKGEIYKIPRWGRGPIVTFAGGLTTPADISVDRKKKQLLIPSMKSNSVSTIPLKK